VSTGRRAVDLIERLEHTFGSVGRDACAGVGHDELVAGVEGPHADPDASPLGAEFSGVVEQLHHRAPEAIPHYLQGFALGPNEMSLVALGMQCLWDEGQLGDDSAVRGELQDAADRYPGSWLKYLVDDTLSNGAEYKGVNPKYRPRGYNEGPKKDE